MNIKLLLLVTLALGFISKYGIAVDSISPMPLPKQLRIESSLPREKVWRRLTLKQKKFAYHLMKAGVEGKKLLAHQIHRQYNLIR